MTTPGYVSNAQLAKRISALVDRWDLREDEMLAFLTQETGEVTVTDGVGREHRLPSIRQLVASVTEMVDELTGETTKAAAYAQDAMGYMQSAQALALTARDHRDAANASADDARVSQEAASFDAASASSAASTASTSADNAHESANHAAAHSGSAATSAVAAEDSASAADASAANSARRAIEAAEAVEEARDAASLSADYANAPQDTEVSPGKFSARHWAAKAQASVTGTLVYMGTWDASTGVYPANPKRGDFYKVCGSGVIEGIEWNTGDQALHNGTSWEKIDNTNSVSSVAGKQGDVVLTHSDIEGLGDLATRDTVAWGSQITGRPSTWPPEEHTHGWDQVRGKPPSYPPEDHGHPEYALKAGDTHTGLHSFAGHTTTWGTPPTAGLRVQMADSTGATWVIHGGAEDAVRFGIQALNQGAAFRIYSGGNVMYANDGVWDASSIPDLPASKIVSGQLHDNRLPHTMSSKTFAHVGTGPTVERTDSTVNSSIEYRTTNGSVYAGAANGTTFAIGGRVGISGSNWMSVRESGAVINGALTLNGVELSSASSSNTLRVASDFGHVTIGPNNTGWCHFQTDRAKFYFNKPISAVGGFEFYQGPRVPRIFVQSGTPSGAEAGDLWLW